MPQIHYENLLSLVGETWCKNVTFSKILQLCLIWEIHFGETKMFCFPLGLSILKVRRLHQVSEKCDSMKNILINM